MTIPSLEARPEPSRIAALAVAAARRPRRRSSSASSLFEALGKNPIAAFHAFFIEPVDDALRRRRAAAEGDAADADRHRACVGYRANVWNIGAEGQLIARRASPAAASRSRSATADWPSLVLLPAMIVAGALGGMLWAAIPAWLRTRFNANEILMSLMLVYVAALVAVAGSCTARGAIRRASTSRSRSCSTRHALLPILLDETRLNVALPARARGRRAGWVFMRKSTSSASRCASRDSHPRRRTTPASPRRRNVWLGMLAGGACAGIAGVGEVAGPIGSCCRRCRPATASPRSSSRSSAGCTRSASCSRAC